MNSSYVRKALLSDLSNSLFLYGNGIRSTAFMFCRLQSSNLYFWFFLYVACQICFYGPNVFKGYLYDEKKTKEAIDEDGWLHSGDIGEWQPVSDVIFVATAGELINVIATGYFSPCQALQLACTTL